MICWKAAASVEVKLPWYVVKSSCPIFSSTLILRSVDSTQAFAAGGSFSAPVLAGAALSSLEVFFAGVLRLWVRALLAIRKMIETEIRSKKRARRPSIGSNPPAAAPSPHLYIAHALYALNATAASAFQNIIVWL